VGDHVRACYPFVRVHTATVARADSRLAYGFVAGPGTYETTLTRPDLFGNYYREQFELLLKNHGVAGGRHQHAAHPGALLALPNTTTSKAA
jgi:AMP nucleosidase